MVYCKYFQWFTAGIFTGSLQVYSIVYCVYIHWFTAGIFNGWLQVYSVADCRL